MSSLTAVTQVCEILFYDISFRFCWIWIWTWIWTWSAMDLSVWTALLKNLFFFYLHLSVSRDHIERLPPASLFLLSVGPRHLHPQPWQSLIRFISAASSLLHLPLVHPLSSFLLHVPTIRGSAPHTPVWKPVWAGPAPSCHALHQEENSGKLT